MQGFFITFKKKFMRLFFTLIFFTILLGCQSDNRSNPRAYVEGNLKSVQFEMAEINVTIKSENTIVGETNPDGSGNFIISGPLLSDSFSLVFNSKIQSFKSSKTGCTISADSLEILIPVGTTYLTFSEIILE